MLVENALFATLDPTVRRAETEDGLPYTLADTVGFVRQPAAPARRGVPFDARGGRPTPTCSCTSSTAATPTPRARSPRCASVLADVGAADVKEIIVVNKADAADPEVLDRLRPPRAALASSSRRGPARASTRCATSSRDELPRPDIEVEVVIPYERGDLVSRLHEESEVLTTEHREDGTFVHAKVHPPLLGELEAYLV